MATDESRTVAALTSLSRENRASAARGSLPDDFPRMKQEVARLCNGAENFSLL